MSNTQSIDRITYIRAIAILAVVTIHFLASMPGKIFTTIGENQLYVAIDQFCRFSVPLFLAVSGYGLFKKYQNSLSLTEFFKRRVFRLIPQYLLWGVGLWFLFRMVPVWYQTPEPVPLTQALLFGSDYHLYFIPLIFQFYVIFPVLTLLVRKWPIQTLMMSVLVQVISLVFFSWYAKQPHATLFTTDQSQYMLATSWIGYFVTGMVLAKNKISLPKHFTLITFIFWLLTYLVMVQQAIQAIAAGIDPLFALKFTRLIVIPYGLLSILLALKGWSQGIFFPNVLRLVFKKIGTFSFIIFLSHTIVLRLIFSYRITDLQWSDWLVTACYLCVLVAISIPLEKK